MTIAYRPKEGYAWNPVRSYPRNQPCPCGKPQKFKRCCLPTMGPTVTTTDAIKLQAFIDEVRRKELQRANSGG